MGLIVDSVMTENKLEAKSVTITDVILVMSKIIEHKLNRSNFIDWSKIVRVYLRSIEKDNHLLKTHPLITQNRPG